MNKKLNATIKVSENVESKYPDTKIYIKENLKKEAIYFAFKFFERIHDLLCFRK